MAGRGPAPKQADQRARRNATIATTKLPASGRKGRTPPWPLIPDIVIKARRDVWRAKVENLEYDLEEKLAANEPAGSVERRLDNAREQLAILDARLAEQRKMETAAWRDLWRTPQAVQWELLGWHREVAAYVRFKVLAELGDMDAAKEARQWSDRLGLSPLALLRLRWEIAPDETPARRGGTRSRGGGRARYGDLKVVGGAGADAS